MSFKPKDLTVIALVFSALAGGCAAGPNVKVKSADTEVVCMEYSAQAAAGIGSRFARINDSGITREVEFTRLARGTCAQSDYAWKDKTTVYEGAEVNLIQTRDGKRALRRSGPVIPSI